MFTGKNVLIVDPDFANATILQLLFEQRGASAVATGDPFLALDRAREGRFDLIILEYRQHGLSGLDIAQRVRAADGEAGETPIVILSSDVHRMREVSCLDVGVDGFLAKPVDFACLLRRVRGILEMIGEASCAEEGIPPCSACGQETCAPQRCSPPEQ